MHGRRHRWRSRRADGRHASVPDDRRRLLEAALHLFPASVYYATPRGARLILVLARPVVAPDRYKALGLAYARRVARTLREMHLCARRGRVGRADVWTDGFRVDEAVSTDLARLLFRPNACVDGVARVGDLRVCSDEPEEEEVVAAWGDEDAEEDPVAAGGSVDDAAARYNADHPHDYPESHGTCPACGHDGCFGLLPDNPGRWVCFSSDHGAKAGRCGLPGNACHHGDALDLDAHAARMTRIDILRRDGYLPAQAPAGAEAQETWNLPSGEYRLVARPDRQRATFVTLELLVAPAKLGQLDSVLEELIAAGRKAIVWSYYVQTIQLLESRYAKYGVVSLYGETPAEERQKTATRFQEDPSLKLLIANPAAAGTGFTLTAASYAVYETLSWRYDQYAQSQDRNHRIGQNMPVTYLRLLAADTVEFAIADSLRRKAGLAADLVGDHADGNVPAQLTRDAFREMLRTGRLLE